MDVSTAFAVVYAADGSRHKVCWIAEEAVAAIGELVAAGLKPVVFARSGVSTPEVVNNAGAGVHVQAHTIHGGVRL